MGGSTKDGGPYYFCYTMIQIRERKEKKWFSFLVWLKGRSDVPLVGLARGWEIIVK